jgi:hypothetical protein
MGISAQKQGVIVNKSRRQCQSIRQAFCLLNQLRFSLVNDKIITKLD